MAPAPPQNSAECHQDVAFFLVSSFAAVAAVEVDDSLVASPNPRRRRKAVVERRVATGTKREVENIMLACGYGGMLPHNNMVPVWHRTSDGGTVGGTYGMLWEQRSCCFRSFAVRVEETKKRKKSVVAAAKLTLAALTCSRAHVLFLFSPTSPRPPETVVVPLVPYVPYHIRHELQGTAFTRVGALDRTGARGLEVHSSHNSLVRSPKGFSDLPFSHPHTMIVSRPITLFLSLSLSLSHTHTYTVFDHRDRWLLKTWNAKDSM